MNSKYLPRTDQVFINSKPTNQLILPSKYNSVVGAKALERGFTPVSPEISGVIEK